MTRYLSLAEYLWLAEQVTGNPARNLAKASRIDMAESALHAPEASFAGYEFYAELLDKAAVLVCRLAWNHPTRRGPQIGSVRTFTLRRTRAPARLNDVRW